MEKIRILLVDDHAYVRAGIRRLVEKTKKIEILGEASSGAQALRMIEKLIPDVLLLDIELPDIKGYEVTRRLKKRQLSVKVLALSAYSDRSHITRMLEAGADGYLTKSEVPQTIMEAIEAVYHGEQIWLSRQVRERLRHNKPDSNHAEFS